MINNLTDIELTEKIQKENCEDSLKELINRHQKLFFNFCSKFSREGNFKYEEAIKDAPLVIWEAAKTYKSDKNTKFSTFLGQYSKYYIYNSLNFKQKLSCLNISNSDNICSYAEHKDLDLLNNQNGNWENPSDLDTIRFIFEILNKQKDKRLSQIFKARFFPINKEESNIKNIAQKYSVTGMQIHNLLNHTFKILRFHLKKEGYNN
jgi:RNA polymerase sigma factor (sigma-70 family)